MTASARSRIRSRPAPLLAFVGIAVVGLAAVATLMASRSEGAAPGYVAAASGGITAQPVLGFPATGATVIGASDADAANAGEVWAEGRIGEVPATLPDGTQVAATEVLVRRTAALGNWQIVPVRDSGGKPLATGWTAATATPAGAVLLAGITAAAGAPADPTQILIQPPDKSGFAAAAALPGGALEPGETLSSTSTESPPILAAVDEEGGTGAFVAPLGESATAPGLLHYATAPASWQREPICATDAAGTCAPPSGPIVVKAISASSTGNAWMVATPAGATGAAATPQLYQRVRASGGASGYIWLAQTVTSPLLAPGAGLVLPGTEAKAGTNSGAVLTASGSGVWLDLVKAGGTGSASLFYSAGKTLGTWCSAALGCESPAGTLPADLPPGYAGTATAPGSETSPGARAITGLPHGAMMALEPGASSFAYRITAGGESEADETVTPDYSGGNTVGPGGVTIAPFLREGVPGIGGGAAFTSLTDAWLGVGGPTPGPQLTHLTGSPGSSALSRWPLPIFTATPLLAIAGQPGTNAAGGEGEAVAVGSFGVILRFRPGQGWSPEAPLDPKGFPLQVQALRGVAWPTPEYVYAVGDGGAMLRLQTGGEIWEVDPGKPAGLEANLTGIAFSAADPGVGYAVGKDGVILSFSAGSWQQQPPPSGLEGADFSSVTFAGEEAIAAYRLPGDPETGGLIVNDGSGWQVDPTLPALFAAAKVSDPVLVKVAGLPDGGAVAAGPGLVVERDTSTSPWRFSSAPLGELEDAGVAALAATRNGSGRVRAIVSVDPDPTDAPNGPGSAWNAADTASPPRPDPEPDQGFLVEETASGWEDKELEDFPGINEPSGASPVDQPGWPEGVYALLVDPGGGSGWAVGGQTGGTRVGSIGPATSEAEAKIAYASRSASAARFGSGPTAPLGEGPPLPSGFNPTGGSQPTGLPTFAFGGGSGCNAPCADAAGQSLGPNVDLAAAISEAGGIPGLRAFVAAGRAVGWTAGSEDGSAAFSRELDQYSSVLSAGPSGLPVYAVPNGPPDNGPGGDIQSPGDEAIYQGALGSHVPIGSSAGQAPPAGTSAYAFVSEGGGEGGSVRVIILDFSQGNSASDQESWLTAELAEAHAAGQPALVVGSDDITDPGAANYAADAEALVAIMGSGLASGYVYDALDHTNTLEEFGPGEEMIAVGVGTLGYGNPTSGRISIPGFLLISVLTDPKAAYPDGRESMVIAGQIPIADSTALAGGPPNLTMKTGETAYFTGVADRPQGGAGGLGTRLRQFGLPAPFCASEINCLTNPWVGFFSSDPTVGEFVAPKSPHEPTVPYVDPKNGKLTSFTLEGLFCATSPGTTTVTFDAGGKTYSRTITVEQGPLGGPCPQAARATPPASPVTNPSQSPVPHESHPAPPPKPSAPVHHHPTVKHHPKPAPDSAQHRRQPAPTAPEEPPPPAQPAPSQAAPKVPPAGGGTPPQPVPPSGISSAPSPVGANAPANVPASTPTTVPLQVPALERRSSAEVGYERAFHNFAAYRPDDGSASPAAIALLLLVLSGGGAAGIAVGLRRSRQRHVPSTRGGPRMALSTAARRDDRRGRR